MINIQSEITKLVSECETVDAIGISGSHARGHTDKLSDIDLCIFVTGAIPTAEERERIYLEMDFSDAIYFDVDFVNSCGDGYWRERVRYDFNWMSIEVVVAFLKNLETNFDSSEYVPGGLRMVKALHDPNGIISALQAKIPTYTDERAKYRIQKNIAEIHFSFYGLGWLEKAVFRKDTYLFLKYKNTTLDGLFRVLYALNREWFSDEKELVRKISSFQYHPAQFESRVISIIMHQDENKELENCLFSLKKLLADTVLIADERYSDLALPHDWE